MSISDFVVLVGQKYPLAGNGIYIQTLVTASNVSFARNSINFEHLTSVKKSLCKSSILSQARQDFGALVAAVIISKRNLQEFSQNCAPGTKKCPQIML